MVFEEHQVMVDWVIGIKRTNGKIVSVFDSRRKPLKIRLKNGLRFIFTGKKAHNTMTNAGYGVSSGLLIGVGDYAVFNYTAIGTGTTNSAATDTALQAEVKRKVGTLTQQTISQTNDTSQLDTIFSSSDGLTGTTAITEIGVLNAASGGILWVHFASSTVMATCNWPNGDIFEAIVKIKNEQGS